MRFITLYNNHGVLVSINVDRIDFVEDRRITVNGTLLGVSEPRETILRRIRETDDDLHYSVHGLPVPKEHDDQGGLG